MARTKSKPYRYKDLPMSSPHAKAEKRKMDILKIQKKLNTLKIIIRNQKKCKKNKQNDC